MRMLSGEYRLRQLLTDPFTTGRDGQRFKYFDGKIHATGGWRDLGGSFETYSEHYTVDVTYPYTVTQLADAPWSPRHTHNMEVLGSKLYVFLGDRTDAPLFHNDMWSYDAVNGWVLVMNDCGVGDRVVASSCTDGEYIYVMGGINQSDYFSDNSVYANIWKWKPGMVSFTKVADFTLPEMDGTNHTGLETGAFYFFKGEMYFRGGGKFWRTTDDPPNSTLPYYTNPCVFKSSDKGVTWEVIATLDRNTVWCQGSCTDKVMFFINGSTGGDNEQRHGIEISEDGINWLRLTYAPGKRHAVSQCVVGDDWFMACGTGEQTFNDLWMVKKIA